MPRTQEDAPRLLIANSNIVPAWATPVNFDSKRCGSQATKPVKRTRRMRH